MVGQARRSRDVALGTSRLAKPVKPAVGHDAVGVQEQHIRGCAACERVVDVGRKADILGTTDVEELVLDDPLTMELAHEPLRTIVRARVVADENRDVRGSVCEHAAQAADEVLVPRVDGDADDDLPASGFDSRRWSYPPRRHAAIMARRLTDSGAVLLAWGAGQH